MPLLHVTAIFELEARKSSSTGNSLSLEQAKDMSINLCNMFSELCPIEPFSEWVDYWIRTRPAFQRFLFILQFRPPQTPLASLVFQYGKVRFHYLLSTRQFRLFLRNSSQILSPQRRILRKSREKALVFSIERPRSGGSYTSTTMKTRTSTNLCNERRMTHFL